MSRSHVEQTPFSFKATYADAPSGYKLYNKSSAYPAGTKLWYKSEGYDITTNIPAGATITNMTNYGLLITTTTLPTTTTTTLPTTTTTTTTTTLPTTTTTTLPTTTTTTLPTTTTTTLPTTTTTTLPTTTTTTLPTTTTTTLPTTTTTTITTEAPVVPIVYSMTPSTLTTLPNSTPIVYPDIDNGRIRYMFVDDLTGNLYIGSDTNCITLGKYLYTETNPSYVTTMFVGNNTSPPLSQIAFNNFNTNVNGTKVKSVSMTPNGNIHFTFENSYYIRFNKEPIVQGGYRNPGINGRINFTAPNGIAAAANNLIYIINNNSIVAIKNNVPTVMSYTGVTSLNYITYGGIVSAHYPVIYVLDGNLIKRIMTDSNYTGIKTTQTIGGGGTIIPGTQEINATSALLSAPAHLCYYAKGNCLFFLDNTGDAINVQNRTAYIRVMYLNTGKLSTIINARESFKPFGYNALSVDQTRGILYASYYNDDSTSCVYRFLISGLTPTTTTTTTTTLATTTTTTTTTTPVLEYILSNLDPLDRSIWGPPNAGTVYQNNTIIPFSSSNETLVKQVCLTMKDCVGIQNSGGVWKTGASAVITSAGNNSTIPLIYKPPSPNTPVVLNSYPTVPVALTQLPQTSVITYPNIGNNSWIRYMSIDESSGDLFLGSDSSAIILGKYTYNNATASNVTTIFLGNMNDLSSRGLTESNLITNTDFRTNVNGVNVKSMSMSPNGNTLHLTFENSYYICFTKSSAQGGYTNPGINARVNLSKPWSIAVAADNLVYVTNNNNSIVAIKNNTPTVTTYAGSNRLTSIYYLAYGGKINEDIVLYALDGNFIKQVNIDDSYTNITSITTIAGGGTTVPSVSSTSQGLNTLLSAPAYLCYYALGKCLFFLDKNIDNNGNIDVLNAGTHNAYIRVYDLETGLLRTVTGAIEGNFRKYGYNALRIDQSRGILYAAYYPVNGSQAQVYRHLISGLTYSFSVTLDSYPIIPVPISELPHTSPITYNNIGGNGWIRYMSIDESTGDLFLASEISAIVLGKYLYNDASPSNVRTIFLGNMDDISHRQLVASNLIINTDFRTNVNGVNVKSMSMSPTGNTLHLTFERSYYICFTKSPTAQGGYINPGASSRVNLSQPWGIAVAADNLVYVTNNRNSIVAIINNVAKPLSYTGTNTLSLMYYITYGGTSTDGIILYVIDGNLIKRVNIDDSYTNITSITTIAGGGTTVPSPTSTIQGLQALLSTPACICYYALGKCLFFLDVTGDVENLGNRTAYIRVYNLETGVLQTVTYAGEGNFKGFGYNALRIDQSRGILYAVYKPNDTHAEVYRHLISGLLYSTTTTTTTLAPTTAPPTTLPPTTLPPSGPVLLKNTNTVPMSQTIDPYGNIYIGSSSSFNGVRMVVYNIQNNSLTNFLASAITTNASSLAFSNNYLYISGPQSIGEIRYKITFARTGASPSVALNPYHDSRYYPFTDSITTAPSYEGDFMFSFQNYSYISIDSAGYLFVLYQNNNNRITIIPPPGIEPIDYEEYELNNFPISQIILSGNSTNTSMSGYFTSIDMKIIKINFQKVNNIMKYLSEEVVYTFTETIKAICFDSTSTHIYAAGQTSIYKISISSKALESSIQKPTGIPIGISLHSNKLYYIHDDGNLYSVSLNASGGAVTSLAVPKIMYERKEKKKQKKLLSETYIGKGGSIILAPSSYAIV